jgi:FkbM family methyltransferase
MTSPRRLIDRVFTSVFDFTALREEVRRLRGRLEQSEADSRGARERTRKLRSVAVDAHHLKSVLPLRAAALRGAHDATACQREADLLARTEAYGAAKRAWEAGERPAGVRHAVSAGLEWSIPEDHGDEHSLSRRIERGWLPLHDIAAVRACAVGGIMLDIGANIGTTCIPRVVLGDFDCVYAAEPEPDNYACLVGTVIDNGLTGRVLPDRVAIANWSGAAALEHTDRIGGHRLLGDASHMTTSSVEVACFTVDRWLRRLRVSPEAVTFVKVDTQGWDVDVLKGASSLLRRPHVVWQLEVSRMVKRSGASLRELSDLLLANFSHAKLLSGGAPALRPVAEVIQEIQRRFDEHRFANILVLNRAT